MAKTRGWRVPIHERIVKSPDPDACWLWNGAHTRGRPVTHRRGELPPNQYVARVVWADAHGPIPDGMQVHHTCENKACVRLDHLLLVTPEQHRALHPRATHCRKGHPITGVNVNGPYCLVCHAARERAYRARKAAERAALRAGLPSHPG